MEMTEEQIAEIEARAASVYPQDAGWSGYEAEDALPVVRDDVPALVAEVRRLRAELDAFKGALSRANELRIGDRAEARLDEREACAVLCENAAGAEASMGDAERAEGDDEHADARMTRASALRQVARAIRARGAGGAR